LPGPFKGGVTKIHALVDGQGLPLRLALTGGQAAEGLLDRLPERTIVFGDKAL
jgi:transposase